MAFAYDGGGLPSLMDYISANNHFNNAKGWRGDSGDGPRKLDGSKRHVTIRKLRDGSIACRLHRTDVITYHPDNKITVIPHGSRSTDEFFNALTRSIYGLVSSFTSGVIQVGEHFYRATNTLKIDLAATRMQVLTETEPFRFRTINRKRAKAARDLYPYEDFSAYAGMMEKMGATIVPRADRCWFDHREKPAALKDRTLWPHLLEGVGGQLLDGTKVDAARTMVTIREAIYSLHPEVYDTTEKPYLESWNEIQRWKKQ